MIVFSEAQKLVIEQARSFGNEKISLDDAAGRVISEKIVADRDYPPFDRASVDGYAIRQSDWNAGLRTFLIREVIFAGKEPDASIEQGECYKIMTGAAVPACADSIIRKEDVAEWSGRIDCSLHVLNINQHIARRGEDVKMGHIISSEPLFCSPAVTGILASIGKHEIVVERLPQVCIITTGDEIISIDSTPGAVQIRNSNRHVLKALLKKWNISPFYSMHVPDAIDEIRSALQTAIQSDIIIICGGVSAGDADHVPGVLTTMGAKKIFHKVAIKPGKPIWFGKFDQGPIVFALPGNPLSCLVTFRLFIETFLFYSVGLKNPLQISLPLRGNRSKKSQLDEFFPVKITGIPSCLDIISFNGSGDITAAIQADAIAKHPLMMPELVNGTILDTYPLF
ncbi:MAG: molybdopterin molybdotransferase MoeA [Chitinophagaceae bacterium]|nr:molybdopterin molybdotransferase MoeA [Chitinophagaceae bacterium]